MGNGKRAMSRTIEGSRRAIESPTQKIGDENRGGKCGNATFGSLYRVCKGEKKEHCGHYLDHLKTKASRREDVY